MNNTNESLKDVKVVLINKEMYQHSSINHLDFGNNNKNDKEKEICLLKEKLNTMTKEFNSLKESTIDKPMLNRNPLTEAIKHNKETFALNQYNKILAYLNIQSTLPNESITLAIDTLLSEHHNYKSQAEIIATMQKQFNAEVSYFNLILAKYDKKLIDLIASFTQCINDTNASTKEKAAKYLINEVDQFINEKQQLLQVNTKQKTQLITLEGEIGLLKNEAIIKGKTIKDLKTLMTQLEHKIVLNDRKTVKSIDYNQCLVNALNQIKTKESEIEKLTKRINDFKGSTLINSRVSYINASNPLEMLRGNESFKVEELRKEKAAIVNMNSNIPNSIDKAYK